jgi:hypothetical protein
MAPCNDLELAQANSFLKKYKKKKKRKKAEETLLI